MKNRRKSLVNFAPRHTALTLASIAFLAACSGGSDSTTASQSASDNASQAAKVSIYRDGMGVPHIEGENAEATMYGAGYAAAEDRLMHLEYMRRVASGKLAEVFGPDYLEADKEARTKGYTDAEARQQINELPEEYRNLFKAHVRGINAYIQKAMQDPASFMPIETKLYGIQIQPFSEEDTARILFRNANLFGGVGGQELNNLAFLSEMRSRYGDAKAQQIFDDIVVLNDPDADTIVKRNPVANASSKVAKVSANASSKVAKVSTPALQQVAKVSAPALHQVAASWQSAQLSRSKLEKTLGFSQGASRTLMVGPKRSANGKVMMLQSTADGYEVHMSGGGFEVAGLASSIGSPSQARGPQHGWLVTTGESDNVDIMEHRLNPSDAEQYWYKGAWKNFETREETIAVRGADAVTIKVRRSVQGPVILHEPAQKLAYAYKNAVRGKELQMFKSRIEFARARSLAEFREAIRGVVQNFNISYGGEDGHIEIWHTGLQPIRPSTVDPRLPAPGDGSADWQGFLPFEKWANEANPEAGYFHAWNNKPTSETTYGDSSRYGKTFRTWLGHDLVASKPKISLDDMKEINRKLANGFGGVDLSSTKPEFFAKYLRAAVANDTDLRRRTAVERIISWNGIYEDNNGDNFYDNVGITLFDTWRDLALKEVFDDDIGDWAEKLDAQVYVQYRTSLLLRALQGTDAGKPMTVDYLNGKSVEEVLRKTLDATLAKLEARFGSPDVDSWRQPVYWRYFDDAAFAKDTDTARGDYAYTLANSAAVQLGKVPERIRHNGNEDWNALMTIDAAKPPLLSVLPTGGQSRFISLNGTASPHIADQVERHRTFDFKSIPLTPSEVRAAAKTPPTVLTYAP